MVLAGVVTFVVVRPVTAPTPLLILSVIPTAPVADHERAVASPVVFVEGVAMKKAMTGAGLMVAELWTGICRSLITSTLTTDAPVPWLNVIERVFRPEVMVPFVSDQTYRTLL